MKLRSAETVELFDSLRIENSTVALLERYGSLVLDANLRINLISRAGDQAWEIERQIQLSLAALRLIPDRVELNWLDIGSGGGFPAVPIALCRPEIHFTLAESITKKAFFLERTCEDLGLANVAIANVRVGSEGEGLPTKRGHFDWISVKAVADWHHTLRWARAFLKVGGRLLTYKPDRPGSSECDSFREFGFELVDDIEITNGRDESCVHMQGLLFSLGRN